MGTIVALSPMAVGIAEKDKYTCSFSNWTVVGGAMFGDNLSMISRHNYSSYENSKDVNLKINSKLIFL